MKLYPSISDDLAEWAQRQPVFFTGSAPLNGAHINVSPKGLADSHFAILGPNQCAYIDRTGSGCETIAHSYENGRLCIMFMSFGAAPRIMRFFCTSRVIEWDEPEFPHMVSRISKAKRETFDGARAVIIADVWEVQTSCGFGVPQVKKSIYAPSEDDRREGLFRNISGEEGAVDIKVDELVVFEERPTMDNWAKKHVDANTLQGYQNMKNMESIDGLPGLKAARRSAGQILWLVDLQACGKRALAQNEGMALGIVFALLLYALVNVLTSVLLKNS